MEETSLNETTRQVSVTLVYLGCPYTVVVVLRNPQRVRRRRPTHPAPAGTPTQAQISDVIQRVWVAPFRRL